MLGYRWSRTSGQLVTCCFITDNVVADLAVLGYECSGTSGELADECRRDSRTVGLGHSTSEAARDSAAAAVCVSRTVSHRYEFVSSHAASQFVCRVYAGVCTGPETISSYHDVVAARSAVGRSLSPVRWPGMRCLTTSETRRSVQTFSGRG